MYTRGGGNGKLALCTVITFCFLVIRASHCSLSGVMCCCCCCCWPPPHPPSLVLYYNNIVVVYLLIVCGRENPPPTTQRRSRHPVRLSVFVECWCGGSIQNTTENEPHHRCGRPPSLTTTTSTTTTRSLGRKPLPWMAARACVYGRVFVSSCSAREPIAFC